MTYRLALSCLLFIGTALSGAHAAQSQGRPKLVPPGWSVQADPSHKNVIRYVSPDRDAVLMLRDTTTGGRSVADEFAMFARQDDGRITYSRRSRSWFVLSGYRGSEIFYTRVDRACGGRRWHVLELTYPRAKKADMDAEVSRLSHALRSYQNICPSNASQPG